MTAPDTEPDTQLSPTDDLAPSEHVGPVLCWVDKKRWWIFAAVVIWWILGFNGQWRIGSDSMSHATVARNLVEGKGFTHSSFQSVNINPGLPYLIAGGYLLTDTNTLWPAITAVFAMGLGVLVIVFHWAKLVFGRPAGVLLTLMVGMNSLLMEFSYTVLTDVPFLLGFMLLLLGLERVRQTHGHMAFTAGLMVGGVVVMGLFRSAVITVVGAVALGTLLWALKKENRPHLKWVLGAGAGGAAVLFLVRLADPHQSGLLNPDETQALSMLTNNLPHQMTVALPENVRVFVLEALPSASVGMQLGTVAGWLIFCVCFIPHAIVLFRKRPLWALIYAAITAQLLLFFLAPRHMLPLTPILAAGWWMLGDAARRKWPRVGLGIMAFMLLCWFTLNFLKGGDLILQQREKPFAEKYKEGRPAALMALGRDLNESLEPDAVLIRMRPGVEAVAFTARRDAIGDQPLKANPEGLRQSIGDRPVYLIGPVGQEDRQWLRHHLHHEVASNPLATAEVRDHANQLKVYRLTTSNH